ncbi:PASTA domain-containing protein [Pengzhenrongella sicca]|uniref:PASTA domain-containing protein n=1 Tax=Pengzhenrongella sicca TaxID=2819238 RepID=A0A8A4ZEC1_9MICO|nr:PASTA domain-containing protein [Pengzhenrongella sicca]QTE30330.1 PASTA domain-containing protein [Pengzhenrongella sicca]
MTASDTSGDTETTTEGRQDARPPRRRRRLPHVSRTWAWVASIIGALLVGFALSQLLVPASVTTERAAVADAPSATAAPTTGPAAMPNVLGLDSATAQRALLDAGVSTTVTFAARPAAGPNDVVVAQDPVGGQTTSGAVVLTLSTSATVPELVGANLADARAALEALGAVVQVTRSVDPNQTEGLVLSVDPASGQKVPAVVTVVVADPGDALTLASVNMADHSGCGTTSNITVNGAAVQDSVKCTLNDSDSSFADWVLAREAVAFEATVGTSDQGATGSAHLRVVGDDRVLLDTIVMYGTSSQVRLDVRDVLRLHVEVTFPDPKSTTPTVILGDARLLGTAEQLAAIEATQ